MFTAKTLYQTLQRLNLPTNLCVAYSGGLDSHALLHSLAFLRLLHPELKLRAVHIHHGLSANADQWAVHCQKACDALEIPLIIKHVNPETYGNKANLEEIAREQRYGIFSEILQPEECLLTAHHQDDQAETLLLRLLRGAGLQGLSAMAEIRDLGQGILARPLLGVSRSDLKNYAECEKLTWIDDESNLNTQLDRNYLRHEVMPLLAARWPSASQVLSRTARHCREAGELLDELAAQDYIQVQGRALQTLSVAGLLDLSLARQKNVLRFWLRERGFLLPSSKVLKHLLKDCLQAKEDAEPLVGWKQKSGGDVEIRRFEGDLYLMEGGSQLYVPLPQPLSAFNWIPRTKYTRDDVSGRGETHYECHSESGKEAYEIYIPEHAQITTRYRRGGERFHPVGRIGSHPLKKLLQEWHVPPWLRDRIPLIYVDEELAIVVGYGVAQKYSEPADGRPKKVLLECRDLRDIGLAQTRRF